MAKSIFDDKGRAPGSAELAAGLGRRAALWDLLVEGADEICQPQGIELEWDFYKKSTGWLCRIKRKRLTLCTLIPQADGILVVFLLPERAVEQTAELRLPARVVAAIGQADRSKLGHAFNVALRQKKDVPSLRKLIGLKLESAIAVL